MSKVALVSLGCAKNLVDSEVMVGYLEKAGYEFAPELEHADYIIINTCGFIGPAKKEAEDSFEKAIEAKSKSKHQKIIAAGCYVERNTEALKERYPEIDIWTGINDFHHIVQIIEGKPYQASAKCFLYDHESPRFLSTPSSWAYVKISEGCSHKCSFCAIPFIKGSYQSRSIDSIVAEVSRMISFGIEEINLISQDSTYYGRDKGLNEGLSMLLEGLLQVQGLEWIRILYTYPEEISDRLLETMQDDRICPYIDSPFQHADQSILKKMRRGMDSSKSLKLIDKMRQLIPEVAIRTSFIVGFPGEGQREFDNLKNFVKAAKFDHLGVFTYSLEEGTDSYFLGDPIPEDMKEERRQNIMELQAGITEKNNKKYLNTSQDVLLEGRLTQDPSVLAGRTRFQAPEVDGLVFMEANGVDSDRIGSIIKVKITDTDVYDLYGNIVE
jgi:ribosomal protein S12 methylthiotransferase